MVCALFATGALFITDSPAVHSRNIAFLPDCHSCLILFFLHSFLNLG